MVLLRLRYVRRWRPRNGRSHRIEAISQRSRERGVGSSRSCATEVSRSANRFETRFRVAETQDIGRINTTREGPVPIIVWSACRDGDSFVVEDRDEFESSAHALNNGTHC